jgi:hypothetical protein
MNEACLDMQKSGTSVTSSLYGTVRYEKLMDRKRPMRVFTQER